MNDSSMMTPVWDPLVRIGHWVLVAGFATAYLTEGEPEWLHTWAGYAIAVTVAIRVVWGFVGPRHARFADFVTGPGKVFAYLRDLPRGRSQRHLGHSPAGGAMTVALLAALAATAFTGMATLAAEDGRGPLSGLIARVPEGQAAMPAAMPGAAPGVVRVNEDEDDSEGVAMAPMVGEQGERGGHGDGPESVWAEVHEVAANLTLVLVILHLAGVVIASLAHRENLPRAMFTGNKRV